jgi:hypothetical protein
MTSPQSTKLPEYSLTDNARNHQAHLQAMGIALYTPLKELDIAQQTWLGDVYHLLGISKEDCLFDSSQPFFDDKLKKLHLPKSTIVNEADFKKLIWQNIRQFIH